MTKMKSKKMTKSTFAIIIMAIAMVAMLAFGGTYAYFTAAAKSHSGEFTTGSVKLTSNASFASQATAIMPGDYIIGAADSSAQKPAASVTVTTNDIAGNYVAIKLTVTITDAEGNEINDAEKLAAAGLTIAPIAGWGQIEGTDVYVYGTASEATAVATGSTGAEDVKTQTLNIFESAVRFVATDVWEEEESDTEGYISKNSLMGVNIEITLTSRSIQASSVAASEAPAKLQSLFTNSELAGPNA